MFTDEYIRGSLVVSKVGRWPTQGRVSAERSRAGTEIEIKAIENLEEQLARMHSVDMLTGHM
jgi:hypothetical protein